MIASMRPRPETADLRALAARGPVHFMGAGGAGMFALAGLLLHRGHRVSGCDVRDGRALRDLERAGATVHVGHGSDHVEGAAALVVTSAVSPEHPELSRARALGVPIFKRADALGAWVARGTVVAVAGTHGKSTTTAMTTDILATAGREPTGLVGGRVTAWEGNLRVGSDELFVVEADEYDRSFLTLRPDIAIVTNVEADHLDIYGDLAGVREGFREFLRGLKPEGRVVACADDPGAAALLPAIAHRAHTYGTSAGSMMRATDVRIADGWTRFRVVEEGADRGDLELVGGGRHNLLNALAAASAARILGVQWPHIRSALSAFRGVGRRFERLGERRGVTVVDDYAHHPTELAATLSAARALFARARLVAVFQPHLYSRTRDFAAEFGGALARADVVWVTDVFPAREAPLAGVSGEMVADAAEAAGAREVHYHADLHTLAPVLASALRAGDVVLTLGAGSVETLGAALLDRLEGAADA